MLADRRENAVEIFVEQSDHGSRTENVCQHREVAQIDQHDRGGDRAQIATADLPFEDQLARLAADIGAEQVLDEPHQGLQLDHGGIGRQQIIHQAQHLGRETLRAPGRPGKRVDRPGGERNRRDHVMDEPLFAQLFEDRERQSPAAVEPPVEPAMGCASLPAPGFRCRSRSFPGRDRETAPTASGRVSISATRRDSADAARASAARRGRAARRPQETRSQNALKSSPLSVRKRPSARSQAFSRGAAAASASPPLSAASGLSGAAEPVHAAITETAPNTGAPEGGTGSPAAACATRNSRRSAGA